MLNYMREIEGIEDVYYGIREFLFMLSILFCVVLEFGYMGRFFREEKFIGI